jgi:hypothetical protein
LSLEGAQLYLAGRDFVAADQPLRLQQSVRNLRFSKGRLESADAIVNIEDADISGTESRLRAGKISITDKSGNLTIDASNVVIGKILSGYNGGTTHIDDITWTNADVRVKRAGGKKMSALVIRNLLGQNTHFQMTGDTEKIETWFDLLSASEISFGGDKEILVSDFKTQGHSFSSAKGNLHLKMDRFDLTDHASSHVKDLQMFSFSGADSFEIKMPALNFIPDINAIVNGRIEADRLQLQAPRIKIKRQPTEPGTVKDLLPFINISDISITQPEFVLDQPASSGFTRIEWHGKKEKENTVHIDRLRVNRDSGIKTEKLEIAASDFWMEANGNKFDAGDGRMKTAIDDFSLRRNDLGDWNWRASIRTLEAVNFLFANLGANAGRFHLASIDLNNLDISSGNILNFRRLLMVNKDFGISNLTGTYESLRTYFSWKNAGFSKVSRKFYVDSFQYRPALPKNEYLSGLKFQKDYTNVETGRIQVNGFDIDRYLGDTILWAKSLVIDGLKMENYRDKHLPFKFGVIKPLPTAAIMKIPVKVDIGEVQIRNADISYAELNNKTNLTGIVNFTHLNATTSAITNIKSAFNDSLNICANAVLLDSFPIDIHFREAYADSIGGFAVDAKIGGGNAKLLNPVISALASVRIESGTLDSLLLHTSGNDVKAATEMKMTYSGLKIKLLNNSVSGKSKRTTKGLASFIANTFAIKNNNRSRTVRTALERVRDKSVFHYLWKTTLKAMAASIGLKKS